ncbi:MAG: hypothetical protein Q4E91_06950 [Lachnospiraceae bacterium]|nr:hypothetical protein [Lachnospiraceae bacterium]
MLSGWKPYKELYVTNNLRLFGLIENELRKSKIEYKTKNVNMGIQNRQLGTLIGRVGERTEQEILYYIYVRPENLEDAKRIVDDMIKNVN